MSIAAATRKRARRSPRLSPPTPQNTSMAVGQRRPIPAACFNRTTRLAVRKLFQSYRFQYRTVSEGARPSAEDRVRCYRNPIVAASKCQPAGQPLIGHPPRAGQVLRRWMRGLPPRIRGPTAVPPSVMSLQPPRLHARPPPHAPANASRRARQVVLHRTRPDVSRSRIQLGNHRRAGLLLPATARNRPVPKPSAPLGNRLPPRRHARPHRATCPASSPTVALQTSKHRSIPPERLNWCCGNRAQHPVATNIVLPPLSFFTVHGERRINQRLPCHRQQSQRLPFKFLH